tara:strand:+ start:280 stop:1017 length:738 start_codon:yes stop_codon:yes gene_type:complete
MLLLSNGCSHTAGAELEYPQQGDCYDKAWPKHLSYSLGYEHINLSMSGASTNRIVRTTYEFIYNWIKQGKSFKDLLVIIMWSGIHRTEIYVDESHSYNYDNNWTPMVVGNDIRNKKQFSSSLYYYYKSWTANMTGYQASCDFYIAVANLQNLLHRYGIKYLFIDAANSGLNTRDSRLDPYRIHIDKRYYEGFDDPKNCYTTLCNKTNQKIAQGSIDSGLNSHYDEDAQIWFAKYIEKIIYERNIL